MHMSISHRVRAFTVCLVASSVSNAAFLPAEAHGQTATSFSNERTIEISASERVEAVAEIATFKVSYQNQAPTKDAAYTENTRVTNKIVKALVDAGVPKDAIETESLTLAKEDDRFVGRPQPMQYSAMQRLLSRTKANEA